jgi:hypothetical protein
MDHVILGEECFEVGITNLKMLKYPNWFVRWHACQDLEITFSQAKVGAIPDGDTKAIDI